MDSNLRNFLAHKLSSPKCEEGKPTEGGIVEVTNTLPVPLRVGVIGTDGQVYMEPNVVPAFGTKPTAAPLKWYRVLLTGDGAILGIFLPTEGTPATIRVTAASLCMPGDIGEVPEPTADIVIPNDSPSVLIAAARPPGLDVYMTRSQYWKRAADSITLAPGEEITTAYTSVSGVQSTSSTTDTVSASLNAGVSVGWGPVAASINAGFNASLTKFQQYVVSDTETRYESRTYRGDGAEVKTIIRWKLMDVVTFFNVNNDGIRAQVNVAQHPDVVREYNHPIDQAPMQAAPETDEKAAETRKEIEQVLEEIRSYYAEEESSAKGKASSPSGED